MPVNFVEGNVYDAPTLLGDQYDIAFVTWGSIIWLPDFRRWAKVVAELLAPGGHPSTLSLDAVDGRLVALRPWRTPLRRLSFMTKRRPTRATQLH